MNDLAVSRVLQNRKLRQSSQVLMGIVTGIIADGQLHDLEIGMLNTWLSENAEVTEGWPGSLIARAIREILADGIVTEDERAHLLAELKRLAGADFSETGSTAAEVTHLPFDHDAHVAFSGLHVCLTGEFMYGTRAACEKISAKVGAIPMASVSKKVSYLIIGTHASPAWANTSYGTKIQKAMDLKLAGHGIFIIPERRWHEALGE